MESATMLILVMLAALAGQAEPTAPAPPVAPAPVATAPDWVRKATGEDMMRYYPRKAMHRGVSGAAIVNCTVTAKGQLTDCSVITETPVGEGFGEAAVKMASLFKMRPLTRDGQPVEGGVVRLPIRFMLPRGGI